MADFSTYHSLGEGEVPDQDKSRSQIRTEPAPPQFTSPVAPPPPGYAQNVNAFGGGAASPPQPQHYQQQQQYGNVQQSPYAGGPMGYPGQQAPPLPTEPQPGAGGMGGLTSQMSGLGIGTESVGGSVRASKKKNRHAYHDIGGPVGSSQPFNGMPQGGAQPSSFLDTGLNQQPHAVAQPPYGGMASPPQQQQQQMHTSSLGTPQPSFAAAGESAVQTQGKVDPENIPSVPRCRDIPAQYYLDHLYPTMERHLPPPATVPFVAHDQGNSSPKFARLTLNNIPATSDNLSSTSLPLGLVIQPLASLDAGDQPVPVLDFGNSGPPRCRRCRAYINPFMQFRYGGNKFVCNMCTFPNDVPPEYFAPVDPSGVRVDRMQRPELTLGTVEFLVPKEYWNKEPVGLRWLFLLDVSQEAVTKGFLEACCDGILAALYGGTSDAQEDDADGNDETPRKKLPEGSRIGIITFDKEVHFYNLSVGLNSNYMAFLFVIVALTYTR